MKVVAHLDTKVVTKLSLPSTSGARSNTWVFREWLTKKARGVFNLGQVYLGQRLFSTLANFLFDVCALCVCVLWVCCVACVVWLCCVLCVVCCVLCVVCCVLCVVCCVCVEWEPEGWWPEGVTKGGAPEGWGLRGVGGQRGRGVRAQRGQGQGGRAQGGGVETQKKLGAQVVVGPKGGGPEGWAPRGVGAKPRKSGEPKGRGPEG